MINYDIGKKNTFGSKTYSYMETSNSCSDNYFVVPCNINSTNWKFYLKCSISQFEQSNGYGGFIKDYPYKYFRIFQCGAGNYNWYSDIGPNYDIQSRINLSYDISLVGIDNIFTFERTPTQLIMTQPDGSIKTGTNSSSNRSQFGNIAIFNDDQISERRRIYNIQIFNNDIIIHDYIPSIKKHRPCWIDNISGLIYHPLLDNNDSIFTVV